MHLKRIRQIYTISFLIVLALLTIAAYIEFYLHIQPCSLCILQRVIFIALAIIFLLGCLRYWPKWFYLSLGFLGILFSLGGILLSARQVWLQYMPVHSAGECRVSLLYMLKILPITEVLQQVWHGGAECSHSNWIFLHLGMAEWSLLFFTIFFLIFIWLQKRILTL